MKPKLKKGNNLLEVLDEVLVTSGHTDYATNTVGGKNDPPHE